MTQAPGGPEPRPRTPDELAAQVGVSVETLRAALKGEPIRERDRQRIERWLYPPPPDDQDDHIVIEPDIGPAPPPPRWGRGG
jgi:hypothetical protein